MPCNHLSRSRARSRGGRTRGGMLVRKQGRDFGNRKSRFCISPAHQKDSDFVQSSPPSRIASYLDDWSPSRMPDISPLVFVLMHRRIFVRLTSWNGAGNFMQRLFVTAEMRRMVRDNLHSRDKFIHAGHAYLLHPVTLYTYALPLTLLFVGLMKPEYPDLDIPEFVGHMITTAKVLVFWLVNYASLGFLAHWFMQRGVPFVAIPVGLWLIAVVGSQVLSIWLVPEFQWSWLRLMRQTVLTLPATIIAVYAAAPMLRARLGELPELVPIWSPYVKVRVPLLLKLPHDRRGRLRRIHAANQYVEVVTEQGTTLLRMTLRDAVALVPADKGWLCHRSLWIRRDEVMSLTYSRGQPQITDSDGQVWPISRKSVPEIREWLSLRAPQITELIDLPDDSEPDLR